MTTVLQFAVLGLGTGTAYTLLAQGVLLVYRGSAVLNFSHAAMAMVGAYLFWQFRIEGGSSFPVAFLAAIIGTSALGVLTYHLVMRPLRTASSLSRVVATLGLLILLQGLAHLIWGDFPKQVNSELSSDLITVAGVDIGVDKLILSLIAVALTAALWAWSRFSAAGLAVRATAENPRAASTLGWSPHVLGTITWGLGGALAAVAGVFIAPFVGISTDSMPLLIIPVLAAVLIGNLSSFWLTLAGAMAIGVAQSLASRYLGDVQGAQQAVPFVIILLFLVFRGRGLPSRSAAEEKRPSLGTGRVDLRVLVPVAVVFVLLLSSVFTEELVIAIGVTLSWGIILLSIVALLGYTGQLSLAQFALGGIATLIAGRLVVDAGFAFPLALIAAIIATMFVGAVFALPALRARGVNLAVITLALGVAVSAMVFNNADLTGGLEGTPVGAQSVFGIDVDSLLYPRRWAILIFALFIICALALANVRRGSAGRRLIAVRTNERAASALGINVLHVKLYAFALAAAVAGVGGILLGFRNPTVLYTEYDAFQSVLAVGYAFIGGIGFLMGGAVGGTLASGGFGGWVLEELLPGTRSAWLVTLGGLFVIGFALLHPDGIVSAQIHQIDWLKQKLFRRSSKRKAGAKLPAVAHDRVPPATLTVTDLVVRFGGVTAVDGATLSVTPGKVVGLIGPNGAGKTTCIDAITGFVQPAEGQVKLDGIAIEEWPVHRRTRAGVSRSFQSLELFESSTVRENLGVASDEGSSRPYVTDIVRPQASPLSPAAVAAVKELNLEHLLDEQVSDLPYGQRRLVAIARAIATSPSILLLDEPAAGLSSAQTLELAAIVRRLADEWGLGILVIEHDMAFVMGICDEVVVLNFGKQIASGPPAQIQRDPSVIAAYLGEDTDEPDPPEPVTSAVGAGSSASKETS
jgi:ABC-type branched-subunit amino acid transport system ATPase component/branched-subunit amino acid ABC-type transport system permease component